MGNASEMNLLVSSISKENDFLMATIYTIFGKSLFEYFSPETSWLLNITKWTERFNRKFNPLIAPYLLIPLLLFFSCSSSSSSSSSTRCAVSDGEWHPALRGLQEEVVAETCRVLRGQPGHQRPQHDHQPLPPGHPVSTRSQVSGPLALPFAQPHAFFCSPFSPFPHLMSPPLLSCFPSLFFLFWSVVKCCYCLIVGVYIGQIYRL